MKHRDLQLLKKIISECKDVIRYTNEIGEIGFLISDIYHVAHGYGELRMGLVWNLSQKEIPDLMRLLEDLLKEMHNLAKIFLYIFL